MSDNTRAEGVSIIILETRLQLLHVVGGFYLEWPAKNCRNDKLCYCCCGLVVKNNEWN